MKVLYLAGKYRDVRGTWYVEQNIQAARKIAVELWQMGYAVICPHANTAFFEGPLNDQQIIDGDLELVKRCDGVVMLPGWETSEGAIFEHRIALEAKKPIFTCSISDKELLISWVNK